MQELVLAKEKSASAWNEASKSMYLLDEQSQKIEELSDQMKELKSFYSTSMQQSASVAATIFNSLDVTPSISCTEPNLPETVRLGSIDFNRKLIFCRSTWGHFTIVLLRYHPQGAVWNLRKCQLVRLQRLISPVASLSNPVYLFSQKILACLALTLQQT